MATAPASPDEQPDEFDPDDSEFPDRIQFEPVQIRQRHDGWTAERQIAFIEALADTGCVEDACRAVGMSDSSAYRLRRQPNALSFREAWDIAESLSAPRLDQAVRSRCINGVPRPIFYKGEQVGEWRHFDERLAMFLLRHHRPQRYGHWKERQIPLAPNDESDCHTLHRRLLGIHFNPTGETDDPSDWGDEAEGSGDGFDE